MRHTLSPSQLKRLCDNWNARHAQGIAVRYYPVIGGKEFREGYTTGRAFVLSGHSAVLFVSCATGCVALEAVEPIE